MNYMNYKNIELTNLENIASQVVKLILENRTNKEEKKEGSGFVIYLEGEMGAGKTTIAQKIGQALGIKDNMQSPTFTLMREYSLENSLYEKLIHVDAYRFENKKEGNILKLNENKNGNIILIEWQKNMHAPNANMIVHLEKVNEYMRDINVELK